MANIIIVDDDSDDIYFFLKACRQLQPEPNIIILKDGMELMSHIEQQNCQNSIILLDLNMPQMGGIEVLNNLNELGKINELVVITYSTSSLNQDIKTCYQLGVKSYITKPDNNKELSDLITMLCKYWFELNHLPKGEAT